MNLIKPIFKSIIFCLWMLLVPSAIWVVKKTGKHHLSDAMIAFCYRGMLYITGVKIRVEGTPVTDRPLLIVSNHISYLDIPIIGTQLPICFTPKDDLAKCFGIGFLCRLCDAVFINRDPKKAGEMKAEIHKRLLENRAVSLFPEATTGDGIHMAPFKSAFFSLAEDDFGDRQLTIQPMALTYVQIRKLPIDRTQWPDIAWYGDMDFVPHLFKLFALAPIEAKLMFLDPIVVEEGLSRKALAARSQEVIQQAIEETRQECPEISKAIGSKKAAAALKVRAS